MIMSNIIAPELLSGKRRIDDKVMRRLVLIVKGDTDEYLQSISDAHKSLKVDFMKEFLSWFLDVYFGSFRSEFYGVAIDYERRNDKMCVSQSNKYCYNHYDTREDYTPIEMLAQMASCSPSTKRYDAYYVLLVLITQFYYEKLRKDGVSAD